MERKQKNNNKMEFEEIRKLSEKERENIISDLSKKYKESEKQADIAKFEYMKYTVDYGNWLIQQTELKRITNTDNIVKLKQETYIYPTPHYKQVRNKLINTLRDDIDCIINFKQNDGMGKSKIINSYTTYNKLLKLQNKQYVKFVFWILISYGILFLGIIYEVLK